MTTLYHFSDLEDLPVGSEFTDSKGESFRKQTDNFVLFNSPTGFEVPVGEIELPVTLNEGHEILDEIYEAAILEIIKFKNNLISNEPWLVSGGQTHEMPQAPKLSTDHSKWVTTGHKEFARTKPYLCDEEGKAVWVDETRTTSATGGQKGKKGEELGAIDPASLRMLARVAAFGGKKYSRMNYLKGYDWSLSFDAMQRHLLAFWEGEDVDPESGLPHTAHAAWHCLALTSYLTRDLGTDDRFKE